MSIKLQLNIRRYYLLLNSETNTAMCDGGIIWHADFNQFYHINFINSVSIIHYQFRLIYQSYQISFTEIFFKMKYFVIVKVYCAYGTPWYINVDESTLYKYLKKIYNSEFFFSINIGPICITYKKKLRSITSSGFRTQFCRIKPNAWPYCAMLLVIKL